MARQVTFEGRTYTFPDDATDQEIADALDSASQGQPDSPPRAPAQPQPRQVGEGEDFVRSLIGGIPRGIAQIAGMRGDFAQAQDQLSDALVRGLGGNDTAVNVVRGVNRLGRDAMMGPGGSLQEAMGQPYTSERALEDVERVPVVGDAARYQPQTRAGRYGRTIGEFAPNAVFPGGPAARLGRVVVPAVASEGAGQLTEGTPLEGPARIGGALLGGVATEASIAQRANTVRRLGQAAPEAEALEAEFGPLTRGERSGNARVRLEEDDLRRGMGSDQAQATMRTFDARRAPVVRENAMRIVTRGQPPLSENAGEAGVILGDELRSARQALWQRAQSQYDEAFKLAGEEPIPPSDELGVRVGEVARENLFEVPPDASRTLGTLQNEISQGRATQANVERARQELSRRRTQAVNARQDADEFVYSRLIETLDDWSSGLVRNAQAQRAMQEARGIYREMRNLYGKRGRTELSTGQTGRMDPGGRAIDRTINTDLTGEQILDGILGTGTRPSAQTLGAVRRIKELGTNTVIYTNRNAQSGVRVPGRERIGGRTAGQRRFAADDPNAPPTQQNPRGGMEQPTPELQALREGLFHRLMRPIDDYIARIEQTGAREGGLLPAQRMVSQLDHALNKAGAEIMGEIYTAREIAAMHRLLRYLQKIVPPPGANYSGTAAALYRSMANAMQSVANVIPGIGWVISALRGMSREFSSTLAAERAVRPVRPRAGRPPRSLEPTEPTAAQPALSALMAAPEPTRRLGSERAASDYSDEELERIAAGAN